MRNTSKDDTLKRNYIQKYQFLIQEYEQVKAKQHPRFRFVNMPYLTTPVLVGINKLMISFLVA